MQCNKKARTILSFLFSVTKMSVTKSEHRLLAIELKWIQVFWIQMDVVINWRFDARTMVNTLILHLFVYFASTKCDLFSMFTFEHLKFQFLFCMNTSWFSFNVTHISWTRMNYYTHILIVHFISHCMIICPYVGDRTAK